MDLPENKLRQFVVDNFLFGCAVSLENDTSFLESGIIDSTGMLEVIMFIEQEYGISIEPHELIPENLDSISRILRFVNRKLQSPAVMHDAVV